MPYVGDPTTWDPATQQGAILSALQASANGSFAHDGRRCNVCDAAYVALRPNLGTAPLVFKSGGVEMPPGRERGKRLLNKVREVHAYAADRDSWVADPKAEVKPEVKVPVPGGPPRHAVSDYVATLVKAGIPVWLHGPAGTGKSSAARHAADAMGIEYREVNLAGAMRSSITGRDRLKEFVPSEFTEAYEHGYLICLEEFDAAHPTVATTINNAIANGHFANDAEGRTITRHPRFRIVATANTLGTGATKEFNGRLKLDGATLDRFRAGRVFVGLDTKLERQIWDLIVANYTGRKRELDRYWSEVERLRVFVASRDSFDPLDSMRIKFDGANAIGCGAPVEAVLASITATWQADTRRQAGIADYDYMAFSA